MNELKNRPLWLLWQKQTRSGGTAKVPFSAKGGSSGTTDTYRNTWVTFSEAEQASKKKAAGIGFKIPNGVFFLDIDHKTIDDPMVRELLSKFHSVCAIFLNCRHIKIQRTTV